MPDLPDLLAAIRDRPDEGPRWLALAAWLFDNGRAGEAAVVRAYWPVLRDSVAETGVSLDATLGQVARHARTLGQRAREAEVRVAGG